jgi:hypothetical protein
MTPKKHFSRFPRMKNALVRGAFLLSISGMVALHTGCGSGSSTENSGASASFEGGVITSIEEVSKDVFKITDEKVVPLKTDSRIITSYLDGKKDTLTLEEAKLISSATSDSTKTNNTHHRRNSGMSSVLMGGVFGYMLGRSMSSPPSPSAYKNPNTYNKVNNSTKGYFSSSKSTPARSNRSSSSSRSGKGGFGG